MPTVPPLAAMKKFCQLIITTPLGDYHLKYPGGISPNWRKLEAGVDDIPPNECWYEFSVSFEGGECIGYCRDIEPAVPLAEPIICSQSSSCCCIEPPEGEECPIEQLAPAPIHGSLTGSSSTPCGIDFGREGQLTYRINCETGKKYRKLWWEYMHAQALSGRFIGYKEHKIVTTGPPCIGRVCYESTWNYNQSTGHECDECPSFNWIGSEDVHEGHNWECDLWNKIWLSNVGLQYFESSGSSSWKRTGWRSTSSSSPRVLFHASAASMFLVSATSLTRCDQKSGLVVVHGDCLLFDFQPPSEFPYWMCDPEFPSGANEPFMADAPFPPDGVTIRHDPSPCPNVTRRVGIPLALRRSLHFASRRLGYFDYLQSVSAQRGYPLLARTMTSKPIRCRHGVALCYRCRVGSNVTDERIANMLRLDKDSERLVVRAPLISSSNDLALSTPPTTRKKRCRLIPCIHRGEYVAFSTVHVTRARNLSMHVARSSRPSGRKGLLHRRAHQ